MTTIKNLKGRYATFTCGTLAKVHGGCTIVSYPECLRDRSVYMWYATHGVLYKVPRIGKRLHVVRNDGGMFENVGGTLVSYTPRVL